VKRLRETYVKLKIGTELIDVSWMTVFNSHCLGETIKDARKRNYAEPFAFNPPLGMGSGTLVRMLTALDAYYENRFASEKDVKITDYVQDAESKRNMLATLHFLQVDSVQVVPELCKAIWEKPDTWGPLDQLHALFANVGFYGQKYLPLMMLEALGLLDRCEADTPTVTTWNDEFLLQVLRFAEDRNILPVCGTVKKTWALCNQNRKERPAYEKWWCMAYLASIVLPEDIKESSKAMRHHMRSLWSKRPHCVNDFVVFKAYQPFLDSLREAETQTFSSRFDFYGIEVTLELTCDERKPSVELSCTFDYGNATGFSRATNIYIMARIDYLEPVEGEIKQSKLDFEWNIKNEDGLLYQRVTRSSEVSQDVQRTRAYLKRCYNEQRRCLFMTINYRVDSEEDSEEEEEEEEDDDE
jgi:hypothetical protein